MIQEKAYAKLNISLDIAGRRDDGYHDMVMVMQTVSLADDICIEFTDDDEIKADTGISYIPQGDQNLGVKAAKQFFDSSGIKTHGMKIHMKKTIPVGAGMAGGSADGAAVLRALNREYGYPLDNDSLLRAAAKVGSDVAFCTLGGTALAKGRGEILTSLEEFPQCAILIAKPTFSISTPELFKAIDKSRIKTHPDTEGIIKALESGNLDDVCRRMYNVFEEVHDRRLKVVTEIKNTMMQYGTKGTIMTGTGSAVFGVYDVTSDLNEIREKFKKEYGFCEIAYPVGKLI